MPEIRNADLTQASDDFDTVYEQAPKAQQKLTSLIASEWQADPHMKNLRHPVPGKQQPWVESADDPGVKGKERSREKMKNDYDNHANKLKDLARSTLRYKGCRRMHDGLTTGLSGAGIQVLALKNKYASPTPMGYSDFNLCVGIELDDQVRYVAEMQLNLDEMIKAKNEAHEYYEVVRKQLPELSIQAPELTIPPERHPLLRGRRHLDDKPHMLAPRTLVALLPRCHPPRVVAERPPRRRVTRAPRPAPCCVDLLPARHSHVRVLHKQAVQGRRGSTDGQGRGEPEQLFHVPQAPHRRE